MTKPFSPAITIEELNTSELNKSYFFIEPMGDGGQGSVFKALSTQDGKEVAVKIYSPNQLLKRAELEVSKLEKANSPYLVRLIEYGTFEFRAQKCFYVVTQFVQGLDLQKMMQIRTLSQEEATKLLRQMLHAIEDLWRLRVVHCDIKPANIMLSRYGDFQLIDLGIAKHLDAQTLTVAGYVMGTFGYMAPEQLRGRKNLTLRVDLFALGIVVYEALTLVHPFHKNQLLIGKIKPTPITEYVDVHENLARAIHWMLEANPIKRPSTCQQILHLIEGVV